MIYKYLIVSFAMLIALDIVSINKIAVADKGDDKTSVVAEEVLIDDVVKKAKDTSPKTEKTTKTAGKSDEAMIVDLDELLRAEEKPEEKPAEKPAEVAKPAVEEKPVEEVKLPDEEIVLEEKPAEKPVEVTKPAVEEKPVEEVKLPDEEIVLEEKPAEKPAEVTKPAVEEKPVEEVKLPDEEIVLEEKPAEKPAEVAKPAVEEKPVEEVKLPDEEIVLEEKPAEKPTEVVKPVEEKVVPVASSIDLKRIMDREVRDARRIGIPEPPEISVKETKPSVRKLQPVKQPEVKLYAERKPSAEEVVLEEKPAEVAKPGQEVPKEEKPLDPRAKEILVTSEEEVLKRDALERYARERTVEGEAALMAGRYEEAVRIFQEALDAFKLAGMRVESKPDIERTRRGLAEANLLWGWALVRVGDYKMAEEKAKRASAEGHPEARKLMDRIKRDTTKPPAPLPVKPPPRWEETDYKKTRESIADLLRKGRQYMETGEFKRARLAFEDVMVIDPENTEAIRMMEKLAQKDYDLNSMELEATRREMMAKVRETWNPRTYGLLSKPEAPKIGEEGKAKPEPGTLSDRRKTIQKLEEIKIPEIEFRQANIHDVVKFLQQMSIVHDKEKKGVNIILKLSGAGAAVPAAGGVGGELGAAFGAGGGAVGAEVPLITFSAKDLSLLEAIKIVTKLGGLKFRVEGTMVLIVPLDEPEGEIINRMYTVLPTVGERIQQLSAELRVGLRREGEGMPFGAPEAGRTTERADWKEFFSKLGVQWPRGSSIHYVPSVGKIVVANTEENLTVFESVLAELNVVPYQVQIEARFIEALQTDLDSLGLEWLLTDNWELMYKKNTAHLPPPMRPRIEMQSGNYTKGNRFLTGAPSSIGASDDSIISVASVLTNPQLALILHALQQRGNTDLLSAPKVTTQAGQEASIKVVTEYIYPTEFTVTGITGTGAGGAAVGMIGAVVEPGGFEMREVGVLLTVTPEVSPDGRMINLTLQPEVVTEPQWKNYGSEWTDPSGRRFQLNMEQPFFHTRTVATSVLIYNGATVAMGGMITEVRTDVQDKIPILGDIPFVGKLFRSKYEKSEKRNLLIFVTALLVDPAGRPLGTAEKSDRLVEEVTRKAAETPVGGEVVGTGMLPVVPVP